jgi:hypothetical protein
VIGFINISTIVNHTNDSPRKYIGPAKAAIQALRAKVGERATDNVGQEQLYAARRWLAADIAAALEQERQLEGRAMEHLLALLQRLHVAKAAHAWGYSACAALIGNKVGRGGEATVVVRKLQRRTIPSHPSACPGHLVGTSVPSRLNKGRCLLIFVAHTPYNASSRPARLMSSGGSLVATVATAGV